MRNGNWKKIEGYDIKVTLVGDSSVGKTTICNHLMGNNNSSSGPTIGSKCEVKLIDSGKSSIRLTLWDTAGQERFRSITPQYLRNTHILLVVFDTNNHKSFENLINWVKEAEEVAPLYDIILIGNKNDLDERAVATKDAKYWAEQWGGHYFDISAFNQTDINNLWNYIEMSSRDIIATRNIPQMELTMKPKHSCCYN